MSKQSKVVRVFLPLSLAATVTPSDDPTLRPGLDPASVTPGTLGFLATLFIVVLVIFLIRDMVKRVRRVRYRAEVEQARMQRDQGVGGDIEGRDEWPARGEAPERADQEPRRPDSGGTPRPGGKHGPDNH